MALEAGFVDPVRESQRVFRATLDALAHPGRVVEVASSATPPAPLAAATAAVLLTLLDYDTPTWLDAAAATPDVIEYVRFHCGAPLVAAPADARFAIVADASALPAFAAFDPGTDERPERSTTVILQVAGLRAGQGRRLRGPGIAGESRLDVAGAPLALWDGVRANLATFPRGIDVVLCAGGTVAALPRTTRVED
ncbi:MAG TPA: phosphonate C-P lyase system protein PhnH [Candidatus Binatia bacterium]|nr:phosphonate C-P lyase system protein PhnH [Candidatus Binatia bacterium]